MLCLWLYLAISGYTLPPYLLRRSRSRLPSHTQADHGLALFVRLLVIPLFKPLSKPLSMVYSSELSEHSQWANQSRLLLPNRASLCLKLTLFQHILTNLALCKCGENIQQPTTTYISNHKRAGLGYSSLFLRIFISIIYLVRAEPPFAIGPSQTDMQTWHLLPTSGLSYTCMSVTKALNEHLPLVVQSDMHPSS